LFTIVIMPSKRNKIGNEIGSWFDKDYNPCMEYVQYDDNKLIFSLNYGKHYRLVRLIIPKNYPDIMEGFQIAELEKSENNLKFIKTINKQLVGRSLTISKILSHVSKIFNKYIDWKNRNEKPYSFNKNERKKPHEEEEESKEKHSSRKIKKILNNSSSEENWETNSPNYEYEDSQLKLKMNKLYSKDLEIIDRILDTENFQLTSPKDKEKLKKKKQFSNNDLFTNLSSQKEEDIISNLSFSQEETAIKQFSSEEQDNRPWDEENEELEENAYVIYQPPRKEAIYYSDKENPRISEYCSSDEEKEDPTQKENPIIPTQKEIMPSPNMVEQVNPKEFNLHETKQLNIQDTQANPSNDLKDDVNQQDELSPSNDLSLPENVVSNDQNNKLNVQNDPYMMMNGLIEDKPKDKSTMFKPGTFHKNTSQDVIESEERQNSREEQNSGEEQIHNDGQNSMEEQNPGEEQNSMEEQNPGEEQNSGEEQNPGEEQNSGEEQNPGEEQNSGEEQNPGEEQNSGEEQNLPEQNHTGEQNSEEASSSSSESEVEGSREFNDENKDNVEKKKLKKEVLVYNDVKDEMGIYLNLKDYISTCIHEEKIKEKLHNLSLLPSKFVIMFNDIKNLIRLGTIYHFHVDLSMIEEYLINLIFKPEFFENSSLFQEIKLMKLTVIASFYPNPHFYPEKAPRFFLSYPHLKNNLNWKIAMMESLRNTEWKKSTPLKNIIMEFQEMMKEAEFSELLPYSKLENQLLELSLLTGIPPSFISRTDEMVQKIQKYHIIVPVVSGENTIQYYEKGTGYGHDGQAKWDIEQLKVEKKQHIEMVTIAIKRMNGYIAEKINDQKQLYDILITSCFIPFLKEFFHENTIANVLEYPHYLDYIIETLRILPHNLDKIYFMTDGNDSIFSSLQHFYEESCNFIKTLNSDDKNYYTIKYLIEIYERLNRLIVNEQDLSKSSVSDNSYEAVLETEKMCAIENFDIQEFIDSFKKKKNINELTLISNTELTKHIMKEYTILKNSIKISRSHSIFYRSTSDLHCHEFLITGVEGTPYDSGCFHIRILCGNDYPQTIPWVHFCTTGNNTVKFNNNLDPSGHICLSLLGTVSNSHPSEKWVPGISNLFQIIYSIQTLVMNDRPYYNSSDKIIPKIISKEELRYNEDIQINTIKWAMIEMLKRPVKGFESAIKKHFLCKREYIKNMCKKWSCTYKTKNLSKFGTLYRDLCHELDKL
jgi:ubiquitin-protein ligase